ncbi:hypothetical protein NPIL_71191 [Nephila pilipes]|uniref:Uncharacterized protein n=1 Tax=Nephila pilipes TaxID=299642 RepID=A0A8X6MUQ4_NEPPI|nr:hypothetical protein NPIL_71191 [Nephila pilipes]
MSRNSPELTSSLKKTPVFPFIAYGQQIDRTVQSFFFHLCLKSSCCNTTPPRRAKSALQRSILIELYKIVFSPDLFTGQGNESHWGTETHSG